MSQEALRSLAGAEGVVPQIQFQIALAQQHYEHIANYSVQHLAHPEAPNPTTSAAFRLEKRTPHY